MTTPNAVKLLTDDTIDAAIAQNDRPVLISFTATWARPCQNLAPVLRQFAESQNDINVAKIDVGGPQAGALPENQNALSRFDIRVYPTLLLFRDGKVAGMAIGEMSGDKLAAWTQTILQNPSANDIAPEDFPAYSAQFYDTLQKAQGAQVTAVARKVTLALSAAEIAGAALLTAITGPFGAAIAGPAALRAAWAGARTLIKRDEMPAPVKNPFLSATFNLSAAASGMALVMAPAASIGLKAACVVFATYFMATGGLRLFADIGNMMGGNKRPAPETPPPPAP